VAAKKKRASKKKKAIPLVRRLPNPPAVYVGRESDLAWLAEAIDRAPVTLITGPGGVGKTALVLQALHTRFGRKIDRMIFVDVPPGQPAAQVRQDILRALAEVTGEEIDWPAIQSDPDAVTAAALDLAEAGPFFVVIDDVFQGESDETVQMLVSLASYARRSRWIATSRSSPHRPELAGQMLALAAMSDDELSELASAWAPGADAVTTRRAIAKASGSPWLLSQLLVTGSSEESLQEEGLLAGLSGDAAEFLRGLTLVEIALPLEMLTLFAPDPGADVLALLEQRGLVTRGAGGIRLHDVARGLLSSGGRGGRGDQAAHAAALLAQQESLDARLEAARLFSQLGRSEALSDLLDRDAERFLEGGYAPRLWKILKASADPSVESWKLRCAADLGNPTALAQVHAPARSGPAETLAWARTLRASGDAEDAAAQLDKILASDLDEETRREAMLLRAACAIHLGRYADAEALLAQTPAHDEATTLTRDAARALARTLAGGMPPLSELVELRRRALDGPEANAAARDLADAFLALGMIAEADELAERGRPRGARAVLLSNRESILLSARAHLERGDLDGARRLADEMRAFARGSSLLLPALHHLDVSRRLVAGELDGLDPFLEACVREVEDIDARTDIELSTVRLRLELTRAKTIGGTPIPEALRETRAGVIHECWKGLRATREQGRTHFTPPPAEGDRRLEILTELLAATHALAAGDTATATHHSVDAVRLGVRYELALLEAHGRALLCDALLCAGRRADLSREAGHLDELARGMGSTRFTLEASLSVEASRSERLPPALLEHLAASGHVAPTAARRARALLGAEPALDHVDFRVLETLAGSAGPFELIGEPPVADEWVPAWGIDEGARAVWLADGRTLEVAGQSLRILTVLADRGGHATKEELVRAAWDEEEYHPLRHDGKLHVAVRKLRETIEDDPKKPVRLATTDDGYRLGGPVRRC
jgi:hypothetical protein